MSDTKKDKNENVDESLMMILDAFFQNVKGKKADVDGINVRHCGREGNWLERQFGVEPNANNSPDVSGYELKKQTNSKTTFGDWSANRYIYKQGEYTDLFEGRTYYEKQNSFCKIFGKENLEKGGRYSWSGSPTPKIDGYNDFGQRLIVDENYDIIAIYSYDEDKRVDKSMIVPEELQVNELEIARWFGLTSPSARRADKCIKDKLEDKFNQKGWFVCKKNSEGEYSKICFGSPINFEKWLELVRNGTVFFDSGMYQGNKRPYSMWRANNALWDSLIIKEFE